MLQNLFLGYNAYATVSSFLSFHATAAVCFACILKHSYECKCSPPVAGKQAGPSRSAGQSR